LAWAPASLFSCSLGHLCFLPCTLTAGLASNHEGSNGLCCPCPAPGPLQLRRRPLAFSRFSPQPASGPPRHGPCCRRWALLSVVGQSPGWELGRKAGGQLPVQGRHLQVVPRQYPLALPNHDLAFPLGCTPCSAVAHCISPSVHASVCLLPLCHAAIPCPLPSKPFVRAASMPTQMPVPQITCAAAYSTAVPAVLEVPDRCMEKYTCPGTVLPRPRNKQP